MILHSVFTVVAEIYLFFSTTSKNSENVSWICNFLLETHMQWKTFFSSGIQGAIKMFRGCLYNNQKTLPDFNLAAMPFDVVTLYSNTWLPALQSHLFL